MALIKATDYLADKGGVRTAIIAEENARAAARLPEKDLGDALEEIADQLPQFGGMVMLAGRPPIRRSSGGRGSVESLNAMSTDIEQHLARLKP